MRGQEHRWIAMAVAGVALTWYLGYYPLTALIEISLF